MKANNATNNSPTRQCWKKNNVVDLQSIIYLFV